MTEMINEKAQSKVEELQKYLEELQTQLEDLLAITSDQLDSESLKHVKIFSTIQRLYTKEVRNLNHAEVRFNIVKSKLKKFYSGKAPVEEYQKKNLKQAPLKSEIDDFMKVDQDFILAKLEYDAQESIVKFLEDCKKVLSERTYSIKYAIDFRKMINGS